LFKASIETAVEKGSVPVALLGYHTLALTTLYGALPHDAERITAAYAAWKKGGGADILPFGRDSECAGEAHC